MVVLDMQGRLVALEALPAAKAVATARSVNWVALLEASGRDPAQVVSITPPVGFAPAADSVAAWRLSSPTSPETTLVAAAARGVVVRVDTFAGESALGRLAPIPDDAPPTMQNWVQVILILVLPLIAGIVIASHNLRAKRGDVRGALVVGISVAILNLVTYLTSTNVGELGPFAILVAMTARAPLGLALVRGVSIAIAYLAIEPYVRRLWPHVLVSWARLVAGRVRDPMIGRDVLIGVAAGAAITFLGAAAQSAERALGFPIATTQLSVNLLATLMGAASALGFVVLTLSVGLQRATIGYTIIVVFRFLFRNNRLAIAATFLLFFLSFLDFTSRAVWFDAIVWLVSLTALLWIVVRFGYLATVATTSVMFMADGLAWTLGFGSWLAPLAMLAWGVIALLLGYGFMTAVGGKSIFSDPLSS
jgi:serine/threonine-protein kinase